MGQAVRGTPSWLQRGRLAEDVTRMSCFSVVSVSLNNILRNGQVLRRFGGIENRQLRPFLESPAATTQSQGDLEHLSRSAPGRAGVFQLVRLPTDKF